MGVSDSERLREYERSFRHAGLPLFSEDTSPYDRSAYLRLRENQANG
jgi:hypothetical protein